jgi:hypothetical protein
MDPGPPQRLVQRLVGRDFDIRFHTDAFPIFSRLRIECAADGDERRIAGADGHEAAEVSAAAGRFTDQDRAVSALQDEREMFRRRECIVRGQ